MPDPARALRPIRRLPAHAAEPAAAGPSPDAAAWAEEREMLLEMLAQQQRVAQAGLVTAGMAHDINNHVQMISGSAYLALMGDRPEEWRQALEKVQEQCREIAETTRTFLSFVRRNESAAEAAFLASDAVEQACRLVDPLARKHGVALEHTVHGDGSVSGDERMLVQALVNLASNAIRACAPKKGRVAIEVSSPTPGFCRFEVSDDGPGIPEDLRGRLFRPFSTGHASSGGNGLGLFIVRQAVRRLGGTIRVRTSPQGTTFVTDLPRAR